MVVAASALLESAGAGAGPFQCPNPWPLDPAKVTRTVAGTAKFTMTDGNSGSFAYTVDGVTQSKAITRQVFQSPGTVCR